MRLLFHVIQKLSYDTKDTRLSFRFVSFCKSFLLFHFASYLLKKSLLFCSVIQKFSKNYNIFFQKKAKIRLFLSKKSYIFETFLSDSKLFYQIQNFSIRCKTFVSFRFMIQNLILLLYCFVLYHSLSSKNRHRFVSVMIRKSHA